MPTLSPARVSSALLTRTRCCGPVTLVDHALDSAARGRSRPRRPRFSVRPLASHLSSTRLADLACAATYVGHSALAWTAEDHEIFDLVSALEAAEGKGTNFCACRAPQSRCVHAS